ncbi:TonB-dependent receptor [Fulvivirga sp. 29W222]|uniref:TonB-dependent receptor n=1 Tax=Fulvivirga marina TaxID=2494733 RepID=A0A937KGE1_9BACT|nr:TonB-dependent receptor [Fulvivirga marina]MBL6449103.1 TonB-dependent receptor [Fulvivirga marina]
MKQKLLLFFMILSITTSMVYAQQQTISGRVTDAGDGLSLPGVNIIESGTNNGTVTDVDGNYSIKVASDATLIFSYVGYTSIEMPVNGRSVINASMEADVTQLAEVVVVGYGVQTKREVTGSIAKVEGEDLTTISVPSFEAALQGKAAGVQVIQGSGTAGSGSMIRVRGIASLSAGGDPLYVVDGIPITQDYFLNGDRGAFNNNPLATINPNDIESVEILKDASAAAIYGSRGANGVILITTKRGKTGKPKFEFSTKLGISKPSREVDLLSSEEWLQLRQEAWENDGNVGLADLPGGITWEQARQTDTDWIDLVTQTGFKQEYNLSMTQGNEKLSSYVGVSYSNNESFLNGNSYERFSGRVNLDYNIMDNLKASLTTSLSQGINNRVSGSWDGGLGAAMSDALPIYPVRNADGTYYTAGNNPVRKQELVDWRSRENRSISTLTLAYEPIDKLNINVSGSLDYMDLQDDQFEPAEWTNTENIARRYPTWVTNYTISGTASYDYTLKDNNKFTFLVGGEYQRSLTEKWNKIEAFGVSGPFYEDPSIPDRGLDGEGKQLSNPVYETAPDEVWSFISYFGRINYAYKDKIFLKASARVDGSSRFGQNNRYGFFPSAGLGYVISEEDFFPSSNVVNFLKLKASWGITGNADIPNYQRWGTFQRREGNDGNPYNQEPIIFPVRLENPDLQWEVQRTYDFGFELGLFEDRVVAELAYFDKNSTDVLIDRLVQASTGFQRYFENIAEINNRGFEIGLKTRNLTGAFTWTTDINASRLDNEVIDIGATPPDAIAGSGDTRVVEGLPVGVNFLNRFSRVDPENGLPIFLDKEGNETYEFNLDDRVPVGSVVPDWTGGITNSFTYKNFDLSVLFTFTIGGNIYDDSGKRQLGVVSDWNMRREIVDRWREPGDVAQFPRLTMEPSTYGGLASFWNLNTTQFLYDGTYGRIRNVTLGYNLPSDLVSKLRLRSARVYFNGTNLITFTKYPGADPEIVRDHNGRQGRNLSPNVTYLTAPQEKAFMLGINVGF